jgi:flagellar M-ring protein FliF
MAERANIQHQLSGFVARLTLGQKMMLVGVTAGVVLGIVLLVTAVNAPSYATLFNNLAPEDASKIVEKLKEQDVSYVLEDGGKTVMVPKQHVYDLRLSLAGQGLPQASVIGYEIFDRTNLGISDFVQKVNYRRAIEGELARTILTLEEVEAARVHLVVPEKTLFKEDEKPATASVVLKLRTGSPLRRETVQGIQHLVSSSVEGLETSHVTIVDSRGHLLSEVNKGSSLAALTSTQYELQQKVETYIARKAQDLLENVVGAGNAIVQVNAELDFRQVERTLEQYDPENTAVRSEQITEEKAGAEDSSAAGSTRSSTVTNYEVNKTVEHIVESMGNIKRLSVAALVNGIPRTSTKEGESVTEIVPRSTEEMGKLTDLVKTAVGFSAQRSDDVTVTNLAFGTNLQEQDFVYDQGPLVMTEWYEYADELILILAMAGGVFILWSLLKGMRGRIEPPIVETFVHAPAPGVASGRTKVELPPAEDEISEEAQLRAERKKRVVEYMKDKPDETARLLKVWLTEE